MTNATYDVRDDAMAADAAGLPVCEDHFLQHLSDGEACGARRWVVDLHDHHNPVPCFLCEEEA